MKKEDFLNKLRKNTHVQFDMPAVDVKGIQYEDTLKQFIEMTESVGGHVIEAKEGESLDELVKKAYPEAKVFASHLPEITIAQKNPDTVAEAIDSMAVGATSAVKVNASILFRRNKNTDY